MQGILLAPSQAFLFDGLWLLFLLALVQSCMFLWLGASSCFSRGAFSWQCRWNPTTSGGSPAYVQKACQGNVFLFFFFFCFFISAAIFAWPLLWHLVGVPASMQKILLTTSQASLLHGARAFVWTCGLCVGHSAASSRQVLVSLGLSFEISSGPEHQCSK